MYWAFLTLLGVPARILEHQQDLFPNLLTRLQGRVYYNLNNWYRALALLPGFSLNANFMETMMGVSSPMPPEVVKRLSPPQLKGFAKIKGLWPNRLDWVSIVRAGPISAPHAPCLYGAVGPNAAQ